MNRQNLKEFIRDKSILIVGGAPSASNKPRE